MKLRALAVWLNATSKHCLIADRGQAWLERRRGSFSNRLAMVVSSAWCKPIRQPTANSLSAVGREVMDCLDGFGVGMPHVRPLVLRLAWGGPTYWPMRGDIDGPAVRCLLGTGRRLQAYGATRGGSVITSWLCSSY